MCWICEGKAKQLFAKKDIPIIKILYNTNQGLVSPYKFYNYELNRLYESDFEIQKHPDRTLIYRGLHSYSNKVRISYTNIRLHVFFEHDTEFHVGWIELDSFGTGVNIGKPVAISGFIPASSYYYLNEKEEYVSSKLVLTNVLD